MGVFPTVLLKSPSKISSFGDMELWMFADVLRLLGPSHRVLGTMTWKWFQAPGCSNFDVLLQHLHVWFWEAVANPTQLLCPQHQEWSRSGEWWLPVTPRSLLRDTRHNAMTTMCGFLMPKCLQQPKHTMHFLGFGHSTRMLRPNTLCLSDSITGVKLNCQVG